MDTSLPAHIQDFATVARDRFTKLGGPQAALLAESDPRIRNDAAVALADLGAAELAPRADPDDRLAAAALCRAAGSALLPYPVVSELTSIDGARLCLIDPQEPRVDHGDLDGNWVLAALDGTTHEAVMGTRRPAKLGPFLVPATNLTSNGRIANSDVDLYLILSSWWLLGALEQALHIAGEHVRARTQFGQALSGFQAVRFSVADASVAVRGLDELAKFTVSRWGAVPEPTARTDALMLKLKAAETGVQLMRTCHQLLGALGFCDESDVSVIDRHIQPHLRLPLGAEDIAVLLTTAVGLGQVETLYS
ncbi:acyl-CoA dehydrogenase family protein [Mycobacteroides abscessus]|uniref:acyl-CoA dehydrogenase family protein n=1 Tax=Mycobacteroides abscessus TaxID=36809 RepID=UPI0009284B7E|nr:acyl-CoA dehydrogenase family protein [Mycobacteroides abscessus]MDO3333907.1 acyl-CoA dehydrogenase family protein [Mycobacteroides abscessus subsp. bolletii]QSM86880.1 acyl-CoA dehydrogenase [Mycobacteroides abscessus subsp. bolletii]SIB89525.1 acyl-CoA dehydrogenase [Mycobacteroides abscessus subsp. bolletii]SKS88127.1 acyl-CoA dehydrogenase [Mycobacteroides abscessus subsp. bolletii]SKT11218.1 acyl-CoA dehydrogenase [Mycobacteroides abscessus subsp. bolletii]